MTKDVRIGILGIGGTGGYFGGKLAKYYKTDDNVKVVFIARNETKRIIAQNGIQVESVEGDFTAKPDLVTDDTTELGYLDVLLVCVKSYSFEEAISRYKNNVKKGGVIITIQNIVNQAERVKNILPESVTLLEGCAYIVSNINGVGKIKHKGGPATIFFGNNTDVKDFKWIEDLFIKAGIKATLMDDISKTIWKKFLFISPLAVTTSYFSGTTIGELRSDPQKLNFMKGLMEELFELMKMKNIDIDSMEIENHLKFLRELPENGKSSLQLDIENRKPSEIDSLLEFVLKESKKHDMELTNYNLAYEKLKKTVTQ